MTHHSILQQHPPSVFVARVVRERQTGRLSFGSRKARYYFEFCEGAIVNVVFSVHRVRRWRRAIVRNVPQLASQLVPETTDASWETMTLYQAIRRSALTREQAQAIYTDLVRETLTFLWNVPVVPLRWQANHRTTRPLPLLPRAALVELLQEVEAFHEQWQAFAFLSDALHRAPLIDESLNFSTSAFSDLLGQFDGTQTVLELCDRSDSTPLAIARILQHFIEQDIVRLYPLEDLPVSALEQHPPPSARPALSSSSRGDRAVTRHV